MIGKFVSSPIRGAVLISAFAILLGFILSGILIGGYEKQLDIQKWLIISGKIINLDANYHQDNSDQQGQSVSGYYYPVLEIEYFVDDSRYVLELEVSDLGYLTKRNALEIYSIGEIQALYVNPKNPREAVLFFEGYKPYGWIGSVLIIMSGAIGLVIITVVGILLGTKQKTLFENVPLFLAEKTVF